MSNSPSRSRGALLRPGFASLLRSPQSRGGRSAEKRSGAALAHPWGVRVTRHARRLARRLASHGGGFGLRGRACLTATPLSAGSGSVTANSSQPGRNAWRAASLPPETTVTSRRPRTPRLAPPSGCLRRTPLNERGWNLCTMNARRSQLLNAICSPNFGGRGHRSSDTAFPVFCSRRYRGSAGMTNGPGVGSSREALASF